MPTSLPKKIQPDEFSSAIVIAIFKTIIHFTEHVKILEIHTVHMFIYLVQ